MPSELCCVGADWADRRGSVKDDGARFFRKAGGDTGDLEVVRLRHRLRRTSVKVIPMRGREGRKRGGITPKERDRLSKKAKDDREEGKKEREEGGEGKRGKDHCCLS